ncbi:hypothetical protein GGQ99_005069 [Aminobacter niigataensis]|uniref:Twin-arginine translocation signal domain-containing protein n=1 Tax=Aminobacter niigataensis TaxID=83265 RepID=A0ABR6L8Z3_9HYPH|nr:twin-arginine translocation signal domain-containing protein [Aminobacter niigataensis]MBB4653284.1 hypothetical protein [Aminobacter niigataensis]
MSITRRLFLRQTAVAGVGATVGSTAVAEPIQPLTPDERIEAAIEEIKAAYWQKWPDAPIRIRDQDNGTDGMILIFTHLECDEPGAVNHERIGRARTMGGQRNG